MIKQYNVYEEVVKEVVPFGNGSIVYTPKKWIGQTVKVVLEREPLNIKEEVIGHLQPFLEHVRGVFLHGSFARGEQTHDSDIDVLVVADKKFKLKKTGRIEFSVTDEETLKKELRGKNPFYIYSILQEAKPILNKELLEELREIKINKKSARYLLEQTESALKVVQELLKLHEIKKRKRFDSNSAIYSLILRARGLFITQCLLKNKKFLNKGLKEFLVSKGLEKKIVNDFYDIYRAERDDKKTDIEVSFEDVRKLYEIVLNELTKMKGK